MDKALLSDMEATIKTLKAVIMRSQSGLVALSNIAKLGPSAVAASAPNIFNELRMIEAELQRLVRAYKDQLGKASVSIPTDAAKELKQ